MQASPTFCAHNAQGQVAVPGRPVACRKCGAQVQPSPRAVAAGNAVGATGLNAAYPGDANTNNTAWAFAQ